MVVDASCLVDVLIGAPSAEVIIRRTARETELAAPHILDVEVFGSVRGQLRRGLIDATSAAQAIEELADWPGERFGHRLLLGRAWELRHTVRGWDAMYVALAEALGVPLLTLDARLARTNGPRCEIELVGGQ